MTKIARLGLTLMLFAIAAVGQDSGEPGKYLLLATNRTGTMEKELNTAGARGYRVTGAQGGRRRSAEKRPSAVGPRRSTVPVHSLATKRTSTMQKELNAGHRNMIWSP